MLHPVTGKAKLCGPCALSALTGLSSETWPDGDIDKRAMPEELDKVGFNAELGGWFRKPLSEFRRPGVWVLVLCYPHPESEWLSNLHVIAYARRRGEIQIADNTLRAPVTIVPGTGWRRFSLPASASGIQRATISHVGYLEEMRSVLVDDFYRVTKKPG